MKTEDVVLEFMKTIAPTVLAQMYKEREDVDVIGSVMSRSDIKLFTEKVSDLAYALTHEYEEICGIEEAIRNM